MTINCPICSNLITSEAFYETVQPVNENVFFDSIITAKSSAIGKISLVFCDKCSFVFNKDFKLDLVDYSDQYQYTLPPSAQFMNFINQMVKTLVHDQNIQNKTILELGCGKGEFLNEICSIGNNKGLGYDTCYEGPLEVKSPKLKFYNRFYNRMLDNNTYGDLVIARQTLEHIETPHSFVLDMLSALKEGGSICLETPNLDWILDNCTFWDFYYEHCSYYNSVSYMHLLSKHGLREKDTYYWFKDQYMSVIAEKGDGLEVSLPDTNSTKLRIENFCNSYQQKRIRIQNFCIEKLEIGNMIIWGGAAKGVTFCNLFRDYLESSVVVDINPIRQDKYIPCVGNKIISPIDAINYNPKTILVMNQQYLNEISQMCSELGIHADVFAVDLI